MTIGTLRQTLIGTNLWKSVVLLHFSSLLKHISTHCLAKVWADFLAAAHADIKLFFFFRIVLNNCLLDSLSLVAADAENFESGVFIQVVSI